MNSSYSRICLSLLNEEVVFSARLEIFKLNFHLVLQKMEGSEKIFGFFFKCSFFVF